jgi:sterol desaturase/sphingolipid hydroxylase (fatty acid hydroxylase superfamily)
VVIAILITGSLGTLWVGALMVVGAVAYEAVAFYRAPMVVASEIAVADARHYERLGLAILGAISIAFIAYWWWHRAV